VNVPAPVVLAIAVPIFILASTLSRLYAVNGRLIVIVAALSLYTIGNIIMVRLMREMGLGLAVSLATIAQFVFINIVAFVVFQERPTSLQLAGMVLGAFSMALMVPRQNV
jgi:small multidrug resistance pump